MLEALKIAATLGLAITLYQTIGWGIDAAIAAHQQKGESRH